MNVKYLNIDGSVKEKTVMLDNKNEQEVRTRLLLQSCGVLKCLLFDAYQCSTSQAG